ncbi:MAG: glycosyltransferase [Planctomycetota bacterium]
MAILRLVRHRAAVEMLDCGASTSEHPRVSILIPARNEEEIIEACVRGALSQSYSNFEVIVCNDDSTDATQQILQKLAAEDSRLHIINKTGLPPAGWIGKNYALKLAFDRADGEWILTLDADCILSSRALESAVHRAIQPKDSAPRSLVSALPDVRCPDLANRLMMPVFGIWLSLALPFHKVNNPKSPHALAAGGFLLIHRNALLQFGGYDRLKSHIVEDVLTARLVKNHGNRIELFLGRGSVSTEMYAGWRDLWEGLTKNTFAASDFSIQRSVIGIFAILTFCVLPIVVCAASLALLLTSQLSDGMQTFSICCLAAYVLLVSVHAAVHADLKLPIGLAALAPAGHAIFACALAVSMIRGTFGSGVGWKGRHYYGSGGERPSDAILTNRSKSI